MRNTPITDELARQFAGKRLSSREAGSVWSLCRDLERELGDMTKQRNHYKAACDQYSEDEMLCKLAEVTKQRDALAEAIETLEAERKDLRDYPLRDAPGHSHDVKSTWDETGEPCSWCLAWDEARAALAATKGGSHE
jgi:hypothetical protein